MMHEADEVLGVARELASKVLALQARCRDGEKDPVTCYMLDDCAALARMVTADLGESEHQNVLGTKPHGGSGGVSGGWQ